MTSIYLDAHANARLAPEGVARAAMAHGWGARRAGCARR